MKRRLFIAAGIFLLCAFALYAKGFLGSSSARVARDHSVALPPSASNIRCGGLFSVTTFGDFEANASFEVASKDLPGVLSQFTWYPDASGTSMKLIGECMPVPTRFMHPDALRWGVSRDGNQVLLQTYDLGQGRNGVCICTMWN